MITTLKAWLAAALVLVAAPSPLTAAQPSQPSQCFTDWAAAALIVKVEKLVTVEALSRQFKRQKLGEIVKTEFCLEPAGYVYRLVVRSPHGRFRSTVFDARRGIEIGVAKSRR